MHLTQRREYFCPAGFNHKPKVGCSVCRTVAETYHE